MFASSAEGVVTVGLGSLQRQRRSVVKGVAVAAPASMLKKVRSRIRRQKIKKFVKRHAGEVLVGVAMGLLTDILTDLAQEHLRKKIVKKFR